MGAERDRVVGEENLIFLFIIYFIVIVYIMARWNSRYV